LSGDSEAVYLTPMATTPAIPPSVEEQQIYFGILEQDTIIFARILKFDTL